MAAVSGRPEGTVRAAGGVVWRETARGDVEIVLVHRPRYDDWTLPKGKLEPDEHPVLAAVREVWEETGIEGVPQVRLPTIGYLTGEPGVDKAVDFWSMRVRADHGREPDHEVAEVRWVPVTRAQSLLTYAHDRGVVAAFAALPRVTGEVVLVRHAHAGSRHAWHGTDELRPLDSLGVRQTAALTPLLRAFEPVRVVSATPRRCRDTVDGLGPPVAVCRAFDEGSAEGIPGAVEALLALAREATPAVVCSQGKVIPPTLSALRPANTTAIEAYDTPKGTGWLLAFAGTDAVAADPLVPLTPGP
ncbi:NUDIX hydrolase [Rugosimonospora africana]|uniref:NUDIX hydrolase n=1 Tax=Rugosimonospora africana TaxID=556532 RepID=A0A8J3QNU3_9ACTN|nr:NUDIX hydrolase [Rugosimonospora africana]GIH13564.1 NUDIX hydrolase [Rugosimonospora africana]